MSSVTNKKSLAQSFLSGFKNIELNDKEIFDRYFKMFPPEISELTFSNIFSWKEAYNFKYKIFRNCLLIGSFKKEKTSFFYPIGVNAQGLMKEILLGLKNTVEFFRVPQKIIEGFLSNSAFKIIEDRNNFDYTYLTKELINLKGKKFDAKRNFIRRFKNKFKYIYHKIREDLIDRCLEFQSLWCQDKNCDSIEGLSHERNAILKMLKNFSILDIKGAALEVDNQIIAISLGEKLNDETFVIHAEKGNALYLGAYQAINQEFLSSEAANFKYVNREQDLGVPGLRKSKLSYQPISLTKKFTVSLKT